jgi:hypothetical protein
MPSNTKIIWVIGSGTGVGKTTIAAAFIRAMNRRGVPTVGFKPYAAGMLRDLIDFISEQSAKSKCSLFGSDGWELSMASPLTLSEFVDVVVPAQFLCHPYWESIMLARTGSVATDNVEYFRSAYTASIQARSDITELATKTALPFGEAKIVEPLRFLNAPSLTPEKQQRAFDFLLALGAGAVVCEGSGQFLPLWQDCPNPDHAVLLAGGTVHFFPNIKARYEVEDGAALTPAKGLLEFLDSARARHFSMPLYVVESGRRQAIADEIVESLIGDAGGDLF